MNPDPRPPAPPEGGPRPTRLFLHEPGWRVGMKQGSEREFCFVMAPGQDFYHRLYDGEIFLQRGDERLCLACAERRGLLAYEPKGLRLPLASLEFDVDEAASPIELKATDEGDWPA